jgi:hypothetical protein
MEKKVCKKCNLVKNISEFNKDKNRNDGLQPMCKVCIKEYKSEYYLKNKNKILDKSKIYYEQNKEHVIERVKSWGDNNQDKIKEYKKSYVKNNRDTINKRMSERKKNEPILKLKMLYRSKINKILGSKREKTFELIGCSPSQLKEYLEKQFLVGMGWENHGLFGWHIDHIIPLSSAKNKEELKKLCHYTNLQPLWALDNIRKRDKITNEYNS